MGRACIPANRATLGHGCTAARSTRVDSLTRVHGQSVYLPARGPPPTGTSRRRADVAGVAGQDTGWRCRAMICRDIPPAVGLVLMPTRGPYRIAFSSCGKSLMGRVGLRRHGGDRIGTCFIRTTTLVQPENMIIRFHPSASFRQMNSWLNSKVYLFICLFSFQISRLAFSLGCMYPDSC